MSTSVASRPSGPVSALRGLAARPRAMALPGGLTIAWSSILVKLSHESPSTAAIFRCAYALPVLDVLAWAEDRRLGPRPARGRRIAAAAGVLLAPTLIFWHHSIEDVGAGLATVLGNLQMVVVPLLAWALEHAAYGAHPARGAAFGVANGVFYAGFILLLRQGGTDLRRPAGPLFDAKLTAIVCAAAIGLATGDAELVPTWPAHAWLLLLALSSQVLGSSLPRLPAAVTSLLITVQPIGSVLLAMAIFGEAPTAPQLGGCALLLAVLVGVTRAGGRAPRAALAPAAADAAPRP